MAAVLTLLVLLLIFGLDIWVVVRWFIDRRKKDRGDGNG